MLTAQGRLLNGIARVAWVGLPLALAIWALFAPVKAHDLGYDGISVDHVVDCGPAIAARLHRTDESLRYPESCSHVASERLPPGFMLLGVAVILWFVFREPRRPKPYYR